MCACVCACVCVCMRVCACVCKVGGMVIEIYILFKVVNQCGNVSFCPHSPALCLPCLIPLMCPQNLSSGPSWSIFYQLI